MPLIYYRVEVVRELLDLSRSQMRRYLEAGYAARKEWA